jgi:class 3 adenylate cyclase
VRGEDIGGRAVHVAARVSVLAGPGKVLVSATVQRLVEGSGIEVSYCGERELKDVLGSWKLFMVKG